MKTGRNVLIYGIVEPYRSDIITIGDCVVIGAETTIITHCPISFYKDEPVEIFIGNNVFVGKGCLILPGTHIGDNVMIGAGSVVAGHIPSNSISSGNPCRVTRAMTTRESQRMKLMTEQGVVGDGTEPDWSAHENR